VRAAATSTLSFDVTAQARQRSGSAVQATKAHVLLRGKKARIESSLGGQKIVMLWLPPYVYRLLPASKTGVRYKASTPLPEMQALAANWPQLMNNPSQIRATLRSRGARKTGTARVDGVATEVYAASRWNGQNRPVKIWLRQSDALPVKMESRAGDWSFIVNWHNYRRNPRLAAPLFAVPKGFRIRDGQPPHSMF
jgi:hypothetical protein